MSKEVFKEAIKQYIESNSNHFNDDKIEFVTFVTDTLICLTDPTIKIRKATNELIYNPVIMDSIYDALLASMCLSKSCPAFEVYWDIMKRILLKIQVQDIGLFEKVIKFIVKKQILFKHTTGIYKGNIFDEIEKRLSPNVHESLKSIYSLNVKIGKNPSGKGEYLLNTFIKSSYKSSDVNINNKEYEVKTDANAPVGESLGSKVFYNQMLKSFFSDVSEFFDYNMLSFGSFQFKKKWAPFFIEFTNKHPNQAQKFLLFQYNFFNQCNDEKFELKVIEYLKTPTIELLSSIYDLLCVHYMKNALLVNDKEKSMIIFKEKNGEATGDYIVFDYKNIEKVFSFAGSETKTLVKIILPKSSATMRPEIYSLNI